MRFEELIQRGQKRLGQAQPCRLACLELRGGLPGEVSQGPGGAAGTSPRSPARLSLQPDCHQGWFLLGEGFSSRKSRLESCRPGNAAGERGAHREQVCAVLNQFGTGRHWCLRLQEASRPGWHLVNPKNPGAHGWEGGRGGWSSLGELGQFGGGAAVAVWGHPGVSVGGCTGGRGLAGLTIGPSQHPRCPLCPPQGWRGSPPPSPYPPPPKVGWVGAPVGNAPAARPVPTGVPSCPHSCGKGAGGGGETRTRPGGLPPPPPPAASLSGRLHPVASYGNDTPSVGGDTPFFGCWHPWVLILPRGCQHPLLWELIPHPAGNTPPLGGGGRHPPPTLGCR